MPGDIAIEDWIRKIYDQYGQRKEMGNSAPDVKLPHFFLHRTFLGDNDLLIIFNTKRCMYQCYFCTLPYKSSKIPIATEDIVAQFKYVLEEMKNSLSVLDRLTFSNEGSVLDADTFPTDALLTIAKGIKELRRVRTWVFETRLEFVDPEVIKQVCDIAPRVKVDVLTGFETRDPYLRDKVLGKKEPLAMFEEGLDNIAKSGVTLSSYVLYKPSQTMTDDEAFTEAEESIDYLIEQCKVRGIKLNCIRINPMYSAKGSRWAKIAKENTLYKPPRITDVMKLAEKKTREGLRVYIGLSTEGLDDPGSSYMFREDYQDALIKPIKLFNDGKIVSFGG